jgi:hypothetical protein
MNWMDFMTGASAVWLLWALLAKLERHQRSKGKKIPPPEYDPKDVALKPINPPRNPGTSWQWHALPGNILELGDTGFYIEHKIKRGALEHPYHGYTPEGVRITWGADLTQMKKYLLNKAEERAEFDCGGKRERP